METEIIFQLIGEIKESIVIINEEFGKAQVDIAVLKTQMSELVWWFRMIVGGLIVWSMAQIGKVIVWVKNNKK